MYVCGLSVGIPLLVEEEGKGTESRTKRSKEGGSRDTVLRYCHNPRYYSHTHGSVTVVDLSLRKVPSLFLDAYGPSSPFPKLARST